VSGRWAGDWGRGRRLRVLREAGFLSVVLPIDSMTSEQQENSTRTHTEICKVKTTRKNKKKKHHLWLREPKNVCYKKFSAATTFA